MHWRWGGGGMSEGAGLRGGRWKTGSGSSPKPTRAALLLCFVHAHKAHIRCHLSSATQVQKSPFDNKTS